jgi:hypothetical protein
MTGGAKEPFHVLKENAEVSGGEVRQNDLSSMMTPWIDTTGGALSDQSLLSWPL